MFWLSILVVALLHPGPQEPANSPRASPELNLGLMEVMGLMGEKDMIGLKELVGMGFLGYACECHEVLPPYKNQRRFDMEIGGIIRWLRDSMVW